MNSLASSHQVEAYIRLSRDDLRQPGTLEEKFALRAQICYNLAQQHGLTLLEENIHYERESGTKLSTRPLALALLERCRTGQTRIVLTPYQDRLTRGDKRDEQAIEDAFCQGRITLITTEGVIPFDEHYQTNHGLLFSIKAAVARHFVADLIHKRKESDAIRLKAGQRTHGTAPYGYTYLRRTYDASGKQLTPQRHVPNPDTYPLVCEIFRRIRHESVNAICEDFNSRRIPPTRGSLWHRRVLHSILTNPFYAGYLSQRQKVHRGERTYLPLDAYVLSEQAGDWEHPVSLAEWYEIQSLLESRKSNKAPRSCLLTGLLYCSQGKPMHGRNGRVYGCECTEAHPGRNCTRAKVEFAALEAMAALIAVLPPSLWSKPPVSVDKGKIALELRRAQRRLLDLQEELVALTRASASLINRGFGAEAQVSLEKVRRERDQVAGEVERLQSAIARPDLSEVMPLLLQLRREGFVPGMQEMTIEEQRVVCQALLLRVELLPVAAGKHLTRMRILYQDLGQPEGFLPEVNVP